MLAKSKTGWVFGLWTTAVVFLGAGLMSLHQPFRSPGSGVLRLAGDRGNGQWRTLHVLSGSCGCSQRVLRHLLSQARIAGVEEEILMIDDRAAYLPGSAELLERLQRSGLPVLHIPVEQVPGEIGLQGVPLLVVASPDGRVVYTGGYGPGGDQAPALLRQARSGEAPSPLPLVGCAVGFRLKRQTDPFHLKD